MARIQRKEQRPTKTKLPVRREVGLLFDVCEFGAAAHGTADSTSAFVAAINASAQARGFVRVPSGEYKISSLEIPSDVDLRFDSGCVIHQSSQAPFISSRGGSRIRISGSASIHRTIDSRTSPMLSLVNCSDIQLEGLSLDGGGVLIDSSARVLIQSLKVKCSGPGITLHAGGSEAEAELPAEEITIRDFVIRAGDCALLIKGDSGGVIRKVLIAGGCCDGSAAGICFAASRGKGGVVEDITIENVDLGELSEDGIRLSAGSEAAASRRGRGPDFKGIVLRNIACRKARTAVHLEGLPDQLLENIELRKVIITGETGLFCSLANGVRLKDVKIKSTIGPSLSFRNSRRVTIDGMHQDAGHGIFLEVRGRETREIVLRHAARQRHRPSVVVGIDVPKDAIVHA